MFQLSAEGTLLIQLSRSFTILRGEACRTPGRYKHPGTEGDHQNNVGDHEAGNCGGTSCEGHSY